MHREPACEIGPVAHLGEFPVRLPVLLLWFFFCVTEYDMIWLNNMISLLFVAIQYLASKVMFASLGFTMACMRMDGA
jgi:hypothetical protein